MAQDATGPPPKAGGQKRDVVSPGATAGSATPDRLSAAQEQAPSRRAWKRKGSGQPAPHDWHSGCPYDASLANLPGGVNLASAAQAGAAALHTADFPPLQKAARSGKSRAAEEPEQISGSDEESEVSDSAASSTAGLHKVSKPTAHYATKPSHRNEKAEGPAHVEVVVNVVQRKRDLYPGDLYPEHTRERT